MKTNICKFLALFLLVLSSILAGQTILNPGEVVIMEFKGNGSDDGFSFMPLVDLEVGTVINFTDYGWNGTSFHIYEDGNPPTGGGNMITYTALSAIPAGTLIRQNTANIGGSAFSANTNWPYNFNNLTYIYGLSSTSSGHDGIIVFQGTPSDPTFIWAYHTGQWGKGSYSDFTWSNLPTNLQNGTNALFFPDFASGTDITVDDGFFKGPYDPATKAVWLARVANSANWTTSVDVSPVLLYPNNYTVTPTATAPTVTTQAISAITSTTATGNGNITALGSPNPTAHGVCWNTTGTPTISDSKVDNGAASNTGAFTAAITGLNPGTLYYIRAYATNSAQTSYGEQVSFTTNPAMSGVYTVGTGGSFPTLNGTGGLFYKINNSLVTGNITAKIISDLSETTTTYLAQQTESGAGNYRVRIIPDGTVNRTITGTQSVLIGFNGGDRVTIDGTAAKLLTFDNSNNISGSGVIPFMIFNSDNDSILNCIIKSVNPASTYVKGISIASSNGTVISKNKIYSLSSGSAADVTAIDCNASYATTSISNNMITLTPSTTGKVIGIENSINSVTALNVDYNSIYIGGIQSGSANSYAFGKTGSITNLRLKDNILYNARVNSVKVTAAKHYAIYMTNIDGITSRDYNLLYSASNYIGRMGTTDYTTLENWSYLTGADDHSKGGTLIFEDYTTGDLRFTRATANSAVFDKGTPIPGITDDYLGKSRTALFYAQVDIGAYELPQSSGLEENILPFETNLAQNYPNPFNPVTAINYELRIADKVKLSIFNTKGELVKTLVNTMQNAGRYSVNFDGAGLNSGVYFYKLEADGKNIVKRMLMVK